MRVSTALFFNTGLNSVNRQQGDLLHVYQQVGSGKRMINPSDDPLGAAQALTLRQSQSMNDRFLANREVAMRNLGEEDNVLQSLITQTYAAKTQLIGAVNGTLSDADRNILAGVFEEMRDSIANLANSKDANGQYLFSGSQGGTAPFLWNKTTGTYSYQGDQVERLVQADQTRTIPSGNNGVDLFLRATPGNMVFLTAGSDNNTGHGVVGGVTISDSSKASKIESYQIKVLGENGPIEVTGVAIPPAQDPPVFSIPTYDPEANSNILDLGNGVSVQLNGKLEAGDEFKVVNAQTQGGDSSLNMLNTLNDVVNALKTPVDSDPVAKAKMQNILNGAMQKLDMSYDNILTVRASVGARMNEIDAITDSGAMQSMHLSSELSRIEDLDYYSASTQLQLRTIAIEAASLAFKRIQGLNLFAVGSRG